MLCLLNYLGETLKNKLKTIMSAVFLAFSFTAVLMLVFIDRLVNGTLYSHGLQFSSGWAFPYQIYFDVCIALVVLNALIVGLGFRYAEKSGKTSRNLSLDTEKVLVSTSEISSQNQPTKSSLTKKKAAVVYCRYCGRENESDAVFCEKCGRRISQVNLTS